MGIEKILISALFVLSCHLGLADSSGATLGILPYRFFENGFQVKYCESGSAGQQWAIRYGYFIQTFNGRTMAWVVVAGRNDSGVPFEYKMRAGKRLYHTRAQDYD